MIDNKYQDLLGDILQNGTDKKDRTGTGTLSVFGRQIRHKMSDGFPLLTTKSMYWKSIVTELSWFLRGDTNIRWLTQNNCNIWNGDAYKKYFKIASEMGEPNYDVHVDDPKQNKVRPLTQKEFIQRIKTDKVFATRFGELGPIYGRQWRNWKIADGSFTRYVDQIADAVNKLKNDPDDRGIIVSAWNVSELELMTLRPCHTFFQLYTRELSHDERQKWVINNVDWIRNSEDPEHAANKYLYRGEPKIYGDSVPKRSISLKWYQRSVDTFLGLPFNIASYALLLEIFAREVNMVSEELIGTFGDVHLYKNHLKQAKLQLSKTPFDLPTLDIECAHISTGLIIANLKDYKSHERIPAPLSN